MIIQTGDKVHIIYRALFENSTRQHFIGEVVAAEGALCRVKGYVFVRDPKLDTYQRKQNRRVTIVDLAESGYIVNVIDIDIDLDKVRYRYLPEQGLVVTDDKDFVLDINEFGLRS